MKQNQTTKPAPLAFRISYRKTNRDRLEKALERINVEGHYTVIDLDPVYDDAIKDRITAKARREADALDLHKKDRSDYVAKRVREILTASTRDGGYRNDYADGVTDLFLRLTEAVYWHRNTNPRTFGSAERLRKATPEQRKDIAMEAQTLALERADDPATLHNMIDRWNKAHPDERSIPATVYLYTITEKAVDRVLDRESRRTAPDDETVERFDDISRDATPEEVELLTSIEAIFPDRARWTIVMTLYNGGTLKKEGMEALREAGFDVSYRTAKRYLDDIKKTLLKHPELFLSGKFGPDAHAGKDA